MTRAARSDAVPAPGALAGLWRERATMLRRHGADAPATTLEAVAGELEASIRAAAETALSLADAASESGFSADHIRHLVSSGAIPNAGRKGSPRVRRQDLPAKAGARRDAAYDAHADATAIRTGFLSKPHRHAER
jgi:hypothetical protein